MSDLLVGFVRGELAKMSRHKQEIGLDARLRECLQQRKGVYSDTKIAQIRQLEVGSEIFLQMSAAKCRAASAMLSEIFITGERPWTIDPTPVPDSDGPALDEVAQRARNVVAALMATGAPLPPEVIEQQVTRVFEEGLREQREQASRRVDLAVRYIADMLEEGGFDAAMAAFVEDFVTYPLAILAGPRPMMQSEVDWPGGKPRVVTKPRLRWVRVDPADLWWSPSARSIEQADVIERMTVGRHVLEAMVAMPGYDADAVRDALVEYGDRGHRERIEWSDAKSDLENQPDESYAHHAFDLLLYTGRLTGAQIRELRVPVKGVRGVETRSWLVSAIICGRYLLKVHVDPDPLQRTPYYVASYEPTPNSIVGTALPELFRSAQEAVNAVARAMLNNVAMASGPQVVINVDALADDAGQRIEQRPWKHWLVSAPMQSSTQPVVFFQPPMNGPELASLLGLFWTFADEVSGVPRYLGGNEKVGGAGRTASGLAMLMGNSTRVMQSIAASIDKQVLEPALQKLYRMLMLMTPEGSPLRGDERVIVKGATYARARETDRMRMLELLSLSANPIDANLLGPEVRADLLLKVARAVGLDIPEQTVRDVLDRATIQRTMAAPGMAMSPSMPAPQGMPATGPRPGGGNGLATGAGQQMPPAAGLANPAVDMEAREMLAARGVTAGPMSRRG